MKRTAGQSTLRAGAGSQTHRIGMRLEMGEGGTTPVDVAVQRETAATLTFVTGTSERVRIDASGRVVTHTVAAFENQVGGGSENGGTDNVRIVNTGDSDRRLKVRILKSGGAHLDIISTIVAKENDSDSLPAQDADSDAVQPQLRVKMLSNRGAHLNIITTVQRNSSTNGQSSILLVKQVSRFGEQMKMKRKKRKRGFETCSLGRHPAIDREAL